MTQKTLTVPRKGIADTVGMGTGMIVPAKRWLPARQQCMYASKDLPMSAILIREVAFQPNQPRDFGLEKAVVGMTLDASMGPRLPRKRSLTFALNHGKAITRVFSGKINLPYVSPRAKRDWLFRIPFNKPFVANSKLGPSLVLDFATTSVATNMNRRWALIQSRLDSGSVKFQGIGYNCHFKKIPFFWQTYPGGISIGATTSWYGAPLKPNQPGFLAIGDAGWGSRWGGLTLPIDLSPFGAPGCKWELRPLLFFPFLVNSRGGGAVSGIRIPSNPRLANLNLYAQGAYAYPKANALGWLFLPSLEWRIGTGEDHDSAAIAAYTYNSIPPGKVSNHWMLGNPVPWCRITYN